MRSLPGTTGVRDPWNHNLGYQQWLLDQVPVHCEHALDVGCGDGWLARRLAERGTWVTGIDLSAPMIDRARQAAVGLPNLTFEIGNLLDHPLPEEGFDFVSAVAVVHHLPFEPALARLAALLRPGGILAVIGLARDASIADLLVSAAAIPINRVLRARIGCPADRPGHVLRRDPPGGTASPPWRHSEAKVAIPLFPGLAQALIPPVHRQFPIIVA